MSKNGNGCLKFLAGIGIGTGLGMLFAPKKGEDLRKDIKKSMDEAVKKAKDVDIKEVGEEFSKKVQELKDELDDLDKEKVLSIAKEKSENLKKKALELVDLAKEKGTPVLEKTADELREKAIKVTKEVLKKLEKSEE